MPSHPRRPLFLLLIGLAAVPLCAPARRGVPLSQPGDWASAKAECAATIQRHDRDARAHGYLGRLARLDNGVGAAVAQFERAVALDPRSIEAHHSLVDFYATAPGLMDGGIGNPRD